MEVQSTLCAEANIQKSKIGQWFKMFVSFLDNQTTETGLNELKLLAFLGLTSLVNSCR